MRQQNNGRRRQNRGSNRRNFNNGNLNGNINKNTVIDSAGPDGRQRGSAAQLNEKYTSLASDASSSDDRILAESFLQFADHYYSCLLCTSPSPRDLSTSRMPSSA